MGRSKETIVVGSVDNRDGRCIIRTLQLFCYVKVAVTVLKGEIKAICTRYFEVLQERAVGVLWPLAVAETALAIDVDVDVFLELADVVFAAVEGAAVADDPCNGCKPPSVEPFFPHGCLVVECDGWWCQDGVEDAAVKVRIDKVGAGMVVELV